MMVEPNLSKEELSDEELIQEFNSPKKYSKARLYAIMAKRANDNSILKEYLFAVIKNEERRKEFVFGAIMHSWLPALHILQNSNLEIKNELKSVLAKVWNQEEKRLFVDYIKKEPEYYALLNDILTLKA
ncbi:hypothetical protein KIM67_12765 [Flagellimonas sp. 389]|uniref:hypothetical protein n=1 Tax=Flagellimonas sp. 389 TaxID=2835862 RepID=UPI001BD511EC|nr:hypothetical protein [Flagellimonas sp. 389]MBS9463282.1 hypothetical protein [Flagellimonas sp. 389]